MKSIRKYFFLLLISNIIGLSVLEEIIPNHPYIYEKNINDFNVELTWRLNLPPRSQFLALQIYAKFNSEPIIIAQRYNKEPMKIVNSRNIPENFTKRLSPTENGIIINRLVFDDDHERNFSASVSYRLDYDYSSKPQDTKLVIIYPPTFIDFPSLTPVLEHTKGSIECMVKSNPKITSLRWDVPNNMSVQYNVLHSVITDEIRQKYNISNESKLFYTFSQLNYDGFDRNVRGNIICEVVSGNLKYNSATFIDVQCNIFFYLDPLSPPEELQAELVSDSEVRVKWKRPSLETGNPHQIQTYRVELLSKDVTEKASKNFIIEKINEMDDSHMQTILSLSDDADNIIEHTMTQSENAALFNLRPNSEYDIRVRAYNGASFSKPSPKISFRTLQSLKPPPTKWTVSQPIMILIIVCSGLFSIMFLMLSITCFVSVRRRKARQWAVLDNPGKKTNIFKDINLVDTPYEYNFDEDRNEEGFANLPPPQLPQGYLQSYQSSAFPNLNNESISVRNLNIQDEIKRVKDHKETDTQTQFATRYISPVVAHEPVNTKQNDTRSTLTSNSRVSQNSNRTAYV